MMEHKAMSEPLQDRVLIQDEPALAEIAERQQSWRLASGLLALLLMALLWIFRDTYWAMVEIWYRSETFAHGFVIAPISLFVIWQMRADLARLPPAPSLLGAPLLAALGFGWLLGEVADVGVVQQFAVVAAIPALVVGVLGLRVAWRMAFPLAYLLFAIPIGEVFIPPLMEFTARFTVDALRLTGVPVYSEGLFLSLPSGDWSVVEGCSGVRYLIASLALGTLYAYLTYASIWRRLTFIACSAIVPIFANGLRAYIIVMLGHLSDMKLAAGVDHLIYGWVFFGIVIFIMFWIGGYFSDRRDVQPASAPGAAPESAGPVRRTQWLIALACLPAFALWPVLARHLEGPPASAIGPIVLAAPQVDGWRLLPTPLSDWTPHYLDTDTQLHVAYENTAGQQVGLYVAYYVPHQNQGKLISTQNVMVVQKHPVWQMPRQEQIRLQDAPVNDAIQAQLRSAMTRFLVWHWYWVAEHHVINPYWGKALEAYSRLFGGDVPSAGIVVYAHYDVSPEEAAKVMREFLNAAFPALEQTLKAGAPQ
jgi:exosortase A